MATYLLHMTGSGEPVGVYTETHDYYDPARDNLRGAGRNVVFSKLPSVPWEDFSERLASTTPSSTMRWDTYEHPEAALFSVLSKAQHDVEETGTPEEE
jgi:hypothetical protein